MKTEFTLSKLSNKDNIATSAVLAVTFLAITAGLFTSTSAVASRAPVAGVQKMETIVVTASRVAPVMLETIIVTAPRNRSHA